MRHRLIRLCIATLFLATPAVAQSPSCEAPAPDGLPEIQRAVSLAVIDRELAACAGAANCGQHARLLYGLTRVDGYILDDAGHDIILVGQAGQGEPLDIDDMVVALRNTLRHYVRTEGNVNYYSAPAVSIDPRPDTMARLESLAAGSGTLPADAFDREWVARCETQQDVRVIGIPKSRTAATMVEADHLMKRFVNGQEQIDHPDFNSLSDLSLALAKQNVLAGRQLGGATGINRFWFTAGPSIFRTDAGAVMIERADVVLLDEAEHLLRTGETVGTGQSNPLARQFSCGFSRLYPALAADSDYPIYRRLSDVFRWVALARLMVRERAFARAGFRPEHLIERHILAPVDVPETVPGIAEIRRWSHVTEDGSQRTRTEISLPSCGGVTVDYADLEASIIPDRAGILTHLEQVVILLRPGSLAAFWDILLAR